MATITHLSHFDLTLCRETKDSVVLSGTLAACRRMAFAHGMEVEKYEGRTLEINGRTAIMEVADASRFSVCWFKGGGLIAKGQDDYSLVIPRNVWDAQ